MVLSYTTKLYKIIGSSQGKLVNGLRVKLAPLQEPDGSTIKYNCTHWK